MSFLGRPSRRLLTGPAIVAIAIISLGLLAPTAALADDGQLKLALIPVGQAGSYFDLTLKPGESRTLSVELANNGDAAIAARTYVADVYTIIDGGFGARLQDEPRTGTSTWISYPAGVVQLAVGQYDRRSLTVTVPTGTGPGEYISSLVLENANPLHAGGAVGINQVVRQALAVVLTVPGARLPGLTIGGLTDKVAGGTSIIQVAVQNTGNIRLKPTVGFALSDSTRAVVSRSSMQMDTFYARTDTTVEFPLATLLAPGSYAVGLTLDDASQGAQVASTQVLVVEGAAGSPAGSPSSAAAPVLGAAPGRSGFPPLAGFALIAALLVVVGVASVSAVRRRSLRPSQP